MSTWLPWVIWGLAGAALEVWGLLTKRHGDTLTENVRWLLSHKWLWWAGLGLSAWTVGHLFLGWS